MVAGLLKLLASTAAVVDAPLPATGTPARMS